MDLLTPSATPVPEPSAWLLLIGGFGLQTAGFIVRGAEETFGGLGILAWADAPG